ncbi:hypothetical protein HYH02_006187 [Chlamydomonas schloesseri]|uniref:NAD-dependent epimerase/dehydratase domain-containing protein n=1 Tax=Chlamydomonas schloesseri TaxID=2026947 RepID=A0A836B677_9CHLO|nr:hypothetical protein HYH02_006187 [Chlamydomonas schloesseri]|eukprot:KAG2448836.1 hypothetical protein HYH02_006187 [Chlamydomonas schloesseri]
MQSSMRARVAGGARRAVGPASRRLTVSVMNSNVLIANTKGGGHAFIGLYLAKELLKKGHKVTILNDGDADKLTKKNPYAKYHELERQGVTIAWGDPAKPSTYPRGNFDVVYDNNGKDLASCQPLIDHFKHKVDHYVFVSSAGAYKADPIEPMHVEGDARKSTAGHVEVEAYLEKARMPYTVFQPLYIYGPNTAKDCEQWFVDRIIRDRPVLLPAPGIQLTSLTHVEDVASMLATVPGNRAAIGQMYNVCSDRCITFTGIAKAIGKALGKDPEIILYSPEKVGTGKSGKAEGFPFRTVHFFASADKAKRELGWKPKHDFQKDVQGLVNDYKANGRDKKEVDFSIDDKILAALGKSVPKSSSSSSSSSSFSRVSSSSSAAKAEELPRSRSSFSPRRDLKIKRTVLPPNWRDSLDEAEPASAKPASGRSATTGRSSSVPKDWRSAL